MDGHIVKVLKTEFLTHNVKHFVVEKPPGYTFLSGQATELSIHSHGLENDRRPFTFTSVNQADFLEFIIKIYKGHNGVTEKLLDVSAGDNLLLQDVFGTITYHGPGLFIAAGAGITPFISIFRQLKMDHQLKENILLFANRTTKDIILKNELKEMLGKNYIDIIEERDNLTEKQFIDKELLKQYIKDKSQFYYICGPEKFTAIMIENLHELGIADAKIIIEK